MLDCYSPSSPEIMHTHIHTRSMIMHVNGHMLSDGLAGWTNRMACYPDVDIKGSELASMTAGSLEECDQLCRDNYSECTLAVYMKDGTCSLRQASPFYGTEGTNAVSEAAVGSCVGDHDNVYCKCKLLQVQI